ncbi:MAG: hypothetical protein JRI97_07710 [Deltaproteobacteria bacterium]|nr:hypothetical protein [Deltaproteobacteria bacterium]
MGFFSKVKSYAKKYWPVAAGAAAGAAMGGGPAGAAYGAYMGYSAVQAKEQRDEAKRAARAAGAQSPGIDDAAVQAQLAAIGRDMRRRMFGRGRAATILTGPGGASGPAPVYRKTLLGQ